MHCCTYPLLFAKMVILLKIILFVIPLYTIGKYVKYNLNVRSLTSAGFGFPAEVNNVFTKEDSKWDAVHG